MPHEVSHLGLHADKIGRDSSISTTPCIDGRSFERDDVDPILLSFFFSSKRRHTRCSRDWSSDVCSSDLKETYMTAVATRNQTFSAEVIEQLRGAVRGAVITPDDPGYDAARIVYNAMIDKRPALIVQCADVADVMQGVTFAATHDLPIAVRGGSHNAAGLGTCDDGIVIDLSQMNAVHVNPATNRVLVEGGATWGDVDHATQPFGL